MNKDKESQIKEIMESLRLDKKELISSFEDGYIGKKVFRITLKDGSSRFCEQITKNKGNGDAVVIIPVTTNGDFVMIIESRPNIDESVVIEFPAGMVDEGEEAVVAARRELLEETGYEADNIYELEWHYQDQGCSKAKITTFIAENCRKKSNQALDGDERLAPIEMTYDEVLELIKESKHINDANTKIAFMNYTLKKKGVL